MLLLYVRLSLCVSVTSRYCIKTAERIELVLGLEPIRFRLRIETSLYATLFYLFSVLPVDFGHFKFLVNIVLLDTS